MTEQKLPKSIRLVHQFEFDRVHSGNVFAADQTLVIKAVKNNSKQTRLGLSIGKKVGNAVCRNRWKRLIRESFRKQKTKLPPGLDIVVRPRKGARCNFESTNKSLLKLAIQIERRLNRRQNSK